MPVIDVIVPVFELVVVPDRVLEVVLETVSEVLVDAGEDPKLEVLVPLSVIPPPVFD